MNLKNSKKSLIFLFSAMTGLMLLTLFNYSFVLLTNPRGDCSLDLLITPACAETEDKYGLDTAANKAYGPTYAATAKTLGVSGLIGQVIGAALSILGVIFLSLMVYGGYIWMTARGQEERINKAKDIIIAAVIGLVVVLAAYVITSFVMSSVVK